MPYIFNQRRVEIDEGQPPVTSGELNYKLTKVCLEYLKSKGSNYQICNDIMGALEGCKQEFYRRAVAPLEDKKILENGDVYGS